MRGWIWAGAVAVTAGFSVASAAHGTESVPRWSGWYVGANAGFAQGDAKAETKVSCGPFVPFYFNCNNQAAVQESGSGPLDADGYMVSLMSGYNVQSSNLVAGVEIEFGVLEADKARSVTAPFVGAAAGVPYTISSKIDPDWLMMFRGRLGFSIGDVLIFGTGGLAIAEVDMSNDFRDQNGIVFGYGSSKSSETKVGWTAGAGIEYAFDQNWSVRTEYLHIDLGSVSTEGEVRGNLNPGAISSFETSSDLTIDVIRAAISYRFSFE